MNQATHTTVLFIIDVIKASYKNQARDITRKLENIDYINIDNLVMMVEKEISTEELTKSYSKVVDMIESIIQD